MKPLRALIRRFRQNDDGATAVEYGLISAGIAITLIVSLTTIGIGLNETFSYIGNALSATQAN